MTLKQKIEAIEALKDKISKGPWDYRFDNESIITPNGLLAMFGTGGGQVYYPPDNRGMVWSSMEFIVESRNTIFELIDAVKEADALITCIQYGETNELLEACEDWLSKYNGGE